MQSGWFSLQEQRKNAVSWKKRFSEILCDSLQVLYQVFGGLFAILFMFLKSISNQSSGFGGFPCKNVQLNEIR